MPGHPIAHDEATKEAGMSGVLITTAVLQLIAAGLALTAAAMNVVAGWRSRRRGAAATLSGDQH
jgi:hypothetical protein